MTEESKPPKKPAKLSPLAAALVGVLTGVVCLGFAVLAHRVGLDLSDTQKDGLIFGGMGALLGGVWGARLMPTKGDS